MSNLTFKHRVPSSPTGILRRLSVFAVALAVSFSVLATPQTAEAQQDPDYQIWVALLGGAKLDNVFEGARLWFDAHTRRGSGGTVFIVRPGLGYQITPWMSAWVGYGWIPVTVDLADQKFDEHRIWQQLIFTGGIMDKQLNFMARTRVEQRFAEGSDDLGHRVRQFVRADWRFKDSPFWLVFWDELFWQLNDTDVYASGFDQNRIFVGPAMKAWDGFRVEVGYLNVVLERGDEMRMQHAAAINFFVTL